MAHDRGSLLTDLAAWNALHDTLEQNRRQGDKKAIATTLDHMADLAGRENQPERALRYREEALSLCRELGAMPALGVALLRVAHLACTINDSERSPCLSATLTCLAQTLGPNDDRSAELALESSRVRDIMMGRMDEESGRWPTKQHGHHSVTMSLIADELRSETEEQRGSAVVTASAPPASPRPQPAWLQRLRQIVTGRR